MATRKLEVFLAASSAKCRILLDGKPVENCYSVSINAEVGEPTRVTLELMNIDAYVVAEDLEDERVMCFDVTPLTADKRKYILVKQAEDNERILTEESNGGEPSQRLQ